MKSSFKRRGRAPEASEIRLGVRRSPPAGSSKATPSRPLRAILIDSVRGDRRLDNSLSAPSVLHVIESKGTLLDWSLHAFKAVHASPVLYIGGYHIQKVMQRFPSLQFRYQADWEDTGELSGLGLIDPEDDVDCLILRASTLCVPEALLQLKKACAQTGAAGYFRPHDLLQFAGLLMLPASRVQEALSLARKLSERSPHAGLEQLVERLRPTRMDLDGLAAPLDAAEARARVVFGGKGRTLQQIDPLLKTAAVPRQLRFRVQEWTEDPEAILARLRKSFPSGNLVVRSSAHEEDGLHASAAGRFRSVLDVPATDPSRVRAAVETVVKSFASDGRGRHLKDEVLVQTQVGKLAASGVLLTRDLETGAAYYVVNIDRSSGRSDTVTSGAESRVDTIYVTRDNDGAALPKDVRAVLHLAGELERITHMDALDVEFGLDRKGALHLFQVRPLAACARRFALADEDLSAELDRVGDFLKAHMRPHPVLAGRTTLLGTMPDWNPAEMIGTAPRPLALSLYQKLIGDETWASARALMGYQDACPEPLIVSLGGRPYVDVRASLNSFLPADLPRPVAETWVDHCLNILHEDSRLHDKVEFEVAITCWTFDWETRAKRLRQAGLQPAEAKDFRARLVRMTDDLITGRKAAVAAQRAELDRLHRRRARWIDDRNAGVHGLARRVNALLADCQRHGAEPFAVLAREAFIALDLLRSLLETGVLSRSEHDTVLRSIPTVASELSRDLALSAADKLSREKFLSRYGHLRPSSYDISSPNYAQGFDGYAVHIRPPKAPEPPKLGEATSILDGKARRISELLRQEGFSASASQLRDFILQSIPAREWAKFEFMKSMDAVLESIADIGQGLDLSREDMSFLPISSILRAATDSASGAFRMELRRAIEFHKKRWELTCALRLPHLVRSPSDIRAFQLEEWSPNFITDRRVVAPACLLEPARRRESLEGKIVLVRAADPGYDWIFGHRIAGLVTQFGGVASHMAIRAAEFGLPAAIGCGELIFERLRTARAIELDCATKRVRPL